MNSPRRLVIWTFVLGIFGLGASLFTPQPPVARTGAPGDNSDCRSCHSGTLNGGPGSVSLAGLTNYVPGQSYTLFVNLTDASKSKYGFEMTALNGSNQAAGNFIVTNNVNTSRQAATISGGTRIYIGHKNANTTSNWSFTWTAPSTDVGPVSFYLRGNATNNNSGTSGDNVYGQTLTVFAPPLAGFTASDTAGCLGQNLTFTDTSSGTINTYDWDFGTDASPATATSAGPHQVSYSSAGNKQVRLITDGPGGIDTTYLPITILPLPSVSLLGVNPSYCDNAGPVTLTGLPSGGVYSGNGISGGVFNPAAAGLGSHQLIYTFTDTTGCAAADTQMTRVDQAPSLTVSPTGNSFNLCDGDTLLLDAGTGFASYQWSNGDTTPMTQIYISGAYDVTVSAANGCTATSPFIVVNVIANPLVDLGPPASSCDSIVLDAGAIHTVYRWSDGSANQMFTARTSGIYWVEVSNSDGCKSRDSVEITIFPSPNLSIQGLNPRYCQLASPATLVGLPLGGSFSGPAMRGNVFDPFQGGTGTVPVTYTFTDTSNCVRTLTEMVRIDEPPDARIVSPTDSFTCLNATPIRLTGIPSGGQFFVGSTPDTVFDPVSAGIGAHLITYIYDDSIGCQDTVEKFILVQPFPIPIVTDLGGDSIGTSPFVSYQWSFVDTFSGATFPISGQNGPNLNTSQLSNDPNYTGAVIVTVSNTFGCFNDSDPYVLPFIESIDPYSLFEKWSLSPNPARNELRISYQLKRASAFELTVMDFQGKILRRVRFSRPAQEGEIALPVDHLAAGLYLISVQVDGERFSTKFMKVD